MAQRFLPPSREDLFKAITTGESYAAHTVNVYPAEAVDATLAIRDYTLKHCEGNLFTLVQHVQRKGFNHGYNFFYQVLSGRYFGTDAKGKQQGAAKSILDVWRQLEVFDRFSTKLANTRFVETHVWHLMNNYVQRKRAPFTCCKFGAVRGRTGNQKSECFREIVRREPPGSITLIEAPETPNLALLIAELAFLLGAKKSDPQAVKREVIRSHFAQQDRVLVVENVQRCFDPRRHARQPVFDFLQKMQEDTRCVVIISWTPVETEFDEAFSNDYFEQFVGRVGGLREVIEIDDYQCDEDILAIAESFGLAKPAVEGAMTQLRSLVREKSSGRVRALFNALQMSARDAYSRKETYTIKHLLSYLAD